MVVVIRWTCFVMVIGLAVFIGSIMIASAQDLVIISIDSPSDGEEVYSNRTTVSGTAMARGGQYIDSVTVNDLPAGIDNWSADIQLEDGSNPITVVATTDMGLSSSKTITVFYNAPTPSPTPTTTPTSKPILTPTPTVKKSYIPITGSIAVSSSPSGAEIYLDGEYQGTTPKTIYYVPPGVYEIVLKKSGYEDCSKSVNVEAIKTIDISPTLTPTLTPTPTPEQTLTPTPKPPETGDISIHTNIESATFTISGPVPFSESGNLCLERDAPAGTYTIIYQDVSGYNTPISETKTLSAGGLITFTGKYEKHEVEWWKKPERIIPIILTAIIAMGAIAAILGKLEKLKAFFRGRRR